MNIIQDIDLLKFEALQQSQSIRPASDFMEEAMERLERGVKIYGDPMPWQKTHDDFRFREGEVTIWAGVNGQGKSLVMGQTAIWLAKKRRVLIASMEMLGSATVARMLRQASGMEKPTRDFMDKFDAYTNDKIWIYDQVGSVRPDAILGMIHWAAVECGVQHIMIDSLVKCGVDSERNEPVKKFVDQLCWAAKNHKVHIHLVHHVRKGQDEFTEPDKNSVKGAGEIVDLCDNLFLIYRNRLKEHKKDRGVLTADERSAPDSFIRVAKHRHGEWEGTWGFWWHEKSQQWIGERGKGAMPYPSPNKRL